MNSTSMHLFSKQRRPEIFVMNHFSEILGHNEFPIKTIKETEEIEISNQHQKLHFDKYGFMKSATVDGTTYPLRVSMNQ